MVAETDQPGETVTGVARRHGVNASMLFAWRKQMQACAAPSDETPPALPPRFVPLAIASSAPPPALPSSYRAPTIELQLAGGSHAKSVGAADPDHRQVLGFCPSARESWRRYATRPKNLAPSLQERALERRSTALADDSLDSNGKLDRAAFSLPRSKVRRP
jgi:hypothetical protein